jgi:S-formylglutathione hydrolase FrmB
MTPLHRNILARHKSRIKGALRLLPFRSRALGISQPVFIYEPPDLRKLSDIHLAYLLRGHEREWVHLEEDETREQTSVEVLDELIVSGRIPPVVAVMPGLCSIDNKTHSLGINMMGTLPESRAGMGTGKFWDFLTIELIPYIEARYSKRLKNGKRLTSGFSLGGFTASLLAVGLPGYFDDVGIFDGLHMYDSQIDIRTGEKDSVWGKSTVFDAALGKPQARTAESLRFWNPSELIKNADPVTHHELEETIFWVRSAAADGGSGNLDRSRYFVELLRESGITAGFSRITFHPDAEHTWHWNDRFFRLFLLNALGDEI